MITLVTGGAGFIGSHLVQALVERGRHVVVLDDFRRGRPENLDSVAGSGLLSVVQGDIRERRQLEHTALLGPFDTVFHLAALHFIPECVRAPAETLSVNVVGTQMVIDLFPCRRFVLASTGDVYAPRESAHQEGDPTEPFNVYGLSKLFAERVVEAATRDHPETTFAVARLFNVYGPRETNPHLIPELLRQVSAGTEIHLGSLWPRRDYTFVADTVAALLSLEAFESAAPFGVFNVGGGTAISVQEVADAIAKVLNRPLTIKSDPSRVRPVERPHLQADIEKIVHSTGWRPRYSLRDGLAALCRFEGMSA